MSNTLINKEMAITTDILPGPALDRKRREELHSIIDPTTKMSVLDRGLALKIWLESNENVALNKFDISDDELSGALAVWQDLCCEVSLAANLPNAHSLYKGLEALDPENIAGHMWAIQGELAARYSRSFSTAGSSVPLQIQNRYIGLCEAAFGRSLEKAEKIRLSVELLTIAAEVED